jgi:type III restriction enzyme
VQAWLFPQVLAITKRCLAECVHLKDRVFPQLLLLTEFAHDAADRIYTSIVQSEPETPSLKPILRAYDVAGSTRYVDFDTTKAVYATRADKCHVSHVIADTGSWEQKMAQVLEDMPEVSAYVKNQGLQFTIPYTINGEQKSYYPDFLVRAAADVTVIVEVSGEARKDKAAKTSTARTLWVPAVNNHEGFGRWAFVEVTDPWDCEGVIRPAIAGAAAVQQA